MHSLIVRWVVNPIRTHPLPVHRYLPFEWSAETTDQRNKESRSVLLIPMKYLPKNAISNLRLRKPIQIRGSVESRNAEGLRPHYHWDSVAQG